ncbi:MAG TPA: hypothetical protein VMG38_20105 [Trebonia sp.]|nr:hypothetical protein [Trebonia sp.]
MSPYRSDLVHGLTQMIDSLRTDPRLPGGIRLSILGFSDDVRLRLPFGDVRGVTSAPNLIMGGTANYGAVFGDLLTRVPADVQLLKTAGHRVFRPLVFFVTSGRPAEASAWRVPHGQLTDRAVTPAAPIIIAYGVGGVPADLMLQIATQPDYAFVASRGLDSVTTVSSLVRALTDTLAAVVITGPATLPAGTGPAGTGPAGTARPPATGPIDLRAARHPTERSRLVLAQGVSIISLGLVVVIVVAAYKADLIVVVLPILAALLLLDVGIRVYRARLLGGSILVTHDSLPSLHADLEAVRALLDYHERADVYVAATVSGSASATRFLGTRVILLEGGFADDLVVNGDSAMRRYVLASMLGALKTKSGQLELAQQLMTITNIVKFTKPFLLPYYRAAQYTGDRIGLQVAGDLPAALQVINRMLVGNAAAPTIGVDGLIKQAEQVRARPLPRLAQLTSDHPHLINRYVSLLAYAKTAVPGQFRQFRDGLTHDAQALLDRLMLPFEQETPAAAAVASAAPLILLISGALVAAAVIAVLLMGSIHLGPSTGPIPVPTPSFTLPTGLPT